MFSKPKSITSCSLQLCAFFVFLLQCTHGLDRQEYIVYMGHLKSTSDIFPSMLHLNFLQKVLGSTTSATITYSYKNSFNGFVAQLTNEEVKLISSMEGVVSVFPNGNNKVYTTKSWDFMGFPQDVKRATLVESNIIVGVIDTGIWPEAESFMDTGFEPPPTKWKGSCRGLTNFICNNKIIGARYYKKDGRFGKDEIQSPRDTIGHGTHTASIVAGGHISFVNFYGLAKGTARGGVPSSRIAVYKVCWSDGICEDADILAAFDDAIKDGVDIISCSLGPKTFASDLDYFKNWIDIGTFHAMRKGILTSLPGGNDGPGPGTIANISPWTITVAASTTNLNHFYPNGFYPNGSSPIVYGGDVAKSRSRCHVSKARKCLRNSLNSKLVRDKILLCDLSNKTFTEEAVTSAAKTSMEAASLAGATGIVIRANKINAVDPFVFSLPGAMVDPHDGNILLNHVKKTRNATAIIMKSIEVIDQFAPYVAVSSSRGPNTKSFHILKPDLCAPGVNILAQWIPRVRKSPYNMKTGTSMACPHVSAAAAYVKSFNPSWSPAAIKSALMTTASKMSPKATLDGVFGYGAGQLNPIGALNPGLIYDANEANYIEFLCGQGYNDKKLKYITGDNSTCKSRSQIKSWNLNLPSFTYHAKASENFKIAFNRTVTNVGFASSNYSITIGASRLLKIQVVPDTLSFSSIGQSQSFTLIVTGVLNRGNVVSTYLSWEDGTHKVRSPIAIYSIYD